MFHLWLILILPALQTEDLTMRRTILFASVAMLAGTQIAAALEAVGTVKQVDPDNKRIVVFANGQDRNLRVADNVKVETQDGKPVAPLLGSYAEYDGGITSFMHLPLIWYVVANDYAFLTRFTPMSPLETELELTWLVHENAVEGRDYDVDKVCWLWKTTADQDKTICENNQRGILSSRYEPGPYSTTEGTAEEFGMACAFLGSVHAGYITGQNLLMDGGQYPGTY